MSEAPPQKKKGLSIAALKGKIEVAKPGESEEPPITSLKKPAQVKAEEEVQASAAPPRPLEPGSRLIFGSKAKAAPGLPKAPLPAPKPADKTSLAKPTATVVSKPLPKPAEKATATVVSKPTTVLPPAKPVAAVKKQVRIDSKPQVKIISPRKVPSEALKAVKAYFDYLKEEYGSDSYETIPLEDMRGEEPDGRFLYIFTEPVEEDFTELEKEFTLIKFTSEGITTDESDEEAFEKEKAKLFDMLREIEPAKKTEEDEEEEEEEVQPSAKTVPLTNFEKLGDSELSEVMDDILYEEGRIPEETLQDKLQSKYKVETPSTGYIPQNRRSFLGFIYDTYARDFELPPLPPKPDPDACKTVLESDRSQMYKYQEFIKEYMSWQTPYRGILVYHGLGSGKTCTSIAAAEALYATADKKIVVMTPFSLRQNFIGEITTCGFRHFRLKNHWTEYKFSENPLAKVFARSVMQIPEIYLERVDSVWIPDFNKEPNYASLTPDRQTRIRDQITNILVFDPNPKKKLDGRIWFINYNGISAKDLLRLACDKSRPFDNKVIIIDEIHNLVRVMQGTIEPYVVEMTRARTKRRIQYEPIEWKDWEPKLCPKEGDWTKFDTKKNYKRGYLFYRLLLGATNSKIIGLSGTPLINFPEEIAILANVLHGYLNIVEGNVAKTDVRDSAADAKDIAIKKTIEEVLTKNPYVDFQEVTMQERSIQFRVTFLPEGIRKVQPQEGSEAIPLGVERMSPESDPISFAKRLSLLQSELEAKGIKLMNVTKDTKIKVTSQPLLPPVGEVFRSTFFEENSVELKPKLDLVLLKRLSGLISYYKGSREDLMPRVTKDETVWVPMSPYQKTQYSKVRLEEIEIEEKEKEKKRKLGGMDIGGRLASLYAEVFEIKNATQNSNYRMASRQSCNFAFPAEVNRPRPRSKDDKDAELGEDKEDIVDEMPAEGEEGENLDAEEDRMEDQVKAEEAGIENAVEGEEEEEDKPLAISETGFDEEATGKPAVKEEVFNEDAALDEAVEKGLNGMDAVDYMEQKRAEFEARKKKTAAKEELTKEQKRCRAVLLPGETYPLRIKRAKECLATVARSKLVLGPGGLLDTSPKFQKMIENITAARGPSLVYSQFLQMEGIGIFTLALEANGYDPIEINFRWETKQAFFSERTKTSLAKGPSENPSTGFKQLRYIKFTGGEEDLVRRYALLLFNGRFSELPREMSAILSKHGWTANNLGDLCRVFCITSAGAEGLSLKNVRAVHIMEPYWNDVRTSQVKGRAIRICSHSELPPSERTVDVYSYVSVFSDVAQASVVEPDKIAASIQAKDNMDLESARAFGFPIPRGARQYVLTSDQHLWLIANRKKAIIENLQRVMKMGAVDCSLNKSENKIQCVSYEESKNKTRTSLAGKVGDFLYDPDLTKDLEKTGTSTAATVVAAKATARAETQDVTAAPPVKREHYAGTINGVNYLLEPIKKDGVPEKYLLYSPTNTSLTKAIGEVKAKPSKKPGSYTVDTKTVVLY